MSNNKKIDIKSSTAEKAIDVARDFANKLLTPSLEELGLLARDQISYWRFKNQVQILVKAKTICEERGINPKSVSPKILCPYLENAALEEDEYMQERWASLLSNMVDSATNLQNHVFPYILGQLSKAEYSALEAEFVAPRERLFYLRQTLEDFENYKIDEQEYLRMCEQKKTVASEVERQKYLNWKRSTIESEARRMEMLIAQKSIRVKSEIISLEEFEFANLRRLGLVERISYPETTVKPVEIDMRYDYDVINRNTLKLQPEVCVTNHEEIYITELGTALLRACCIHPERYVRIHN